MQNMLEKKMLDQVYNYLDGTIYSMVKCFKTRKLREINFLSVLSRNRKKNKKVCKKRKAATFDDF